jgi:hypothetical protein
MFVPKMADLPRMMLVTPKVSFMTHVTECYVKSRDVIANDAISYDQQSGDPSEGMTRFLSDVLGIEPFSSPPKDHIKMFSSHSYIGNDLKGCFRQKQTRQTLN